MGCCQAKKDIEDFKMMDSSSSLEKLSSDSEEIVPDEFDIYNTAQRHTENQNPN